MGHVVNDMPKVSGCVAREAGPKARRLASGLALLQGRSRGFLGFHHPSVRLCASNFPLTSPVPTSRVKCPRGTAVGVLTREGST